MKTAAEYECDLRQSCPHSKLVDEYFRRVTLKLECAKCREAVIGDAMREAAINMRDDSAIIVGDTGLRSDSELLRGACVSMTRQIMELPLPAPPRADGGDGKEKNNG